MQVIIDESGRLTGIVEELLDFSRMQNGKLSMRMEKIDVLAELDDAVFVFRERALREGIERWQSDLKEYGVNQGFTIK